MRSRRTSRTIVVAALGITQTLAWGSSYYLPAVLGAPIAAALGLPANVFFGVFSAALLLGGAISPWVGRRIDRHGGRAVLAASNAVLAAGLVMLGLAQGVVTLALAWLVLGIGMALGLYDPAFATLTRLYGASARPAITGITLIAGFASTLGWPLTAWLEGTIGWRGACFVWALVNLVLALPLNWFLIPPAPPLPATADRPIGPAAAPPHGAMPILATAFVTGAMAAHLPRFLEIAGATPAAAIAAGVLVGPAQVAARLAEFGLLRTIHPVWSGRLAAALHPLGVAVLAALGASGGGAAAFATLHGAGNGLVTIARGTLPLAIFGPRDYGLRTGMLAVPSRLALAAAPLLFGVLLDMIGVFAVLVSTGLSLAAVISLMLLRAGPAPVMPAPADA